MSSENDPPNLLARLTLWAAFWGVSCLAMPTAANADQAAPGWEFYFSPYLWISGVTGTTTTSNPNIPAQTSTASFGSLLSHLNSVPLVGAAEIRHGRFGILTDLMGISLAANLSTKGTAFSGERVQLTELLSTVMPMYRVVELSNQRLDIGIGARVIAYWTKISANPGTLSGFTRKASLSWADPLLGARYHLDFSPKWGATSYGDVGGVGGNLTWQLLGLIDYRYSNSLVFHFGYRYLEVNYHGNKLRSDTALSGPILGATARF